MCRIGLGFYEHDDLTNGVGSKCHTAPYLSCVYSNAATDYDFEMHGGMLAVLLGDLMVEQCMHAPGPEINR